MSRPKIELGPLRHGEIERAIPGQPRLHVESGWIRSQRTGRERLVWLIYLRPPAQRTAKILKFPARTAKVLRARRRRET